MDKTVDLVIDVPQWLIARLDRFADICDRSSEQVALSIFAAEVVHT